MALDNLNLADSSVQDWLIPRVEVLITQGDADMVSMGLRHGKPMVTLPVIRE
jgi:UDP:flavonoid glycosyltransferase YjiC (YdhE family)